MKHYTVAEIETTDGGWVHDYVVHVTPMVEAAGGRYLARTSDVVGIEGEPPARVALLIEWPSEQAALAFYESEEYAPFRQRRTAGARSRMALVAGNDAAGRASGLPPAGASPAARQE